MLISQPSGKSASLDLFGIIYPVLSSARLPSLELSVCAGCAGIVAVPSTEQIFDWNLYFLRLLSLLAFFSHSLCSIAAHSLARSTNTFLLAISRLLSLLLPLGGRCRFPASSHLIPAFNHFLRFDLNYTSKNFFQRNWILLK